MNPGSRLIYTCYWTKIIWKVDPSAQHVMIVGHAHALVTGQTARRYSGVWRRVAWRGGGQHCWNVT